MKKTKCSFCDKLSTKASPVCVSEISEGSCICSDCAGKSLRIARGFSEPEDMLLVAHGILPVIKSELKALGVEPTPADIRWLFSVIEGVLPGD